MAETPPVWTVFSGTGQRSSSSFAALAPKRLDAAAPPPVPDLDAVAAEAREAGRQEGEALLAQAVEAAVAAERDRAAAALADARALWVDAEAAALAEAFAAQVQALEARLAESLARVLQPVLAEALVREAIREVRETLRIIMADDRAGTLAVAGPADLVEALARHLDLPPGRLTVTPDDRPDLRIRTNGTLIETRLRAWSERLSALVEDR